MKLFGYYKSSNLDASEIEPQEIAEITLVASSNELRKIAKFLEIAAESIAENKEYDHLHLSDKFYEFESSPHFVVFKEQT